MNSMKRYIKQKETLLKQAPLCLYLYLSMILVLKRSSA